MNKYFKKNEAEKYVFYKIPKALFTDDNTNPFQPMQKCSTDCCLTECICPLKTVGLISTAEYISSSR